MPGFHFSGQKLDNELVASISRLLDAAGVPNLLWGNYMLTLYGVPTIVDVSVYSTTTRLWLITNPVTGRLLCGSRCTD